MIRKTLPFIFLMVVSFESLTQSTDYPLSSDAYSFVDRWAVKSKERFFTTVKPLSRKKVIKHFEAFSESRPAHEFNKHYVLLDSREYASDSLIGKVQKPFLNTFYKYESDMFSASIPGLDFHLNPVIHFAFGRDSELNSALYTNTRGIELRGTIDEKLSFYTSIHENQMRLPGYVQSVQDTVGVIPFEGFWKEFDGGAYDFLRARGYVDFNIIPHISAQLGFGNHFIGNGKRSLILSDFANAYPYLRLTTEIWKFKYTNIFAEMIADVFFFDGGTLGSQSYPKKYFAFHHLDMAITQNLHIGLFESVITGRPDSLGGSDLKLQYLNPIIFYGAIEQQDGSADNVIVGTDFRWDALNKAQLYGQFTLDELVVSELLSNSGWWGNKFGFQLGLKYFDFLVPTWHWQVEYNQARPFTYSHDGDFTAYTHYRQPLAHPLGANFRELIVSSSYQPLPRLQLDGTLMVADYGSGPVDGFSVGRNPLINSNNRGVGNENDFDNRQGQGIGSNLLLGQFIASYQLKHNLFLDFQLIYRNEDREDRPVQSSTVLMSGVRLNLPRRSYLF